MHCNLKQQEQKFCLIEIFFFFLYKIFANYVEKMKNLFPWYVDEIKGIADGSNLPFEWVRCKSVFQHMKSFLNLVENGDLWFDMFFY